MDKMDTAGDPGGQAAKPKKEGKPKKEKVAKDPAAPKAPRARTSKNFHPASTIKVLAEKNPKRATSAAYKRFDLYQNDMTVEAFIKAGGTYGDLSWDSERKYIEVSPAPAQEPTPAPQ
jgi:hypothetical protein